MLQLDKILHFSVSFVLAMTAGIFLSPIIGILCALAIGALKEVVHDWLMKRGNPCWWDMLANCLGVAFAVVCMVRGGIL